MQQIKAGFFTIDTVHAVLEIKDLEEAKNFVREVVKESKSARSTNTEKALTMISRATSVQNLAIAISNFMLAHPSENLKTL